MLRLLARSGIKSGWLWLVLLASNCFFLLSCGETTAPTEQEQSEPSSISFSIKLSKLAVASLVRAEVVITASGMEKMTQPLTITGDQVTGRVSGIPAGNDRTFTLNGYDSSGTLIYTGFTQVDMPAGKTVEVIVTMRRVASSTGPRLRIISPVTTQRYPLGTVIVGEIENFGSTDAFSVSVNFTARNRNSAAVASYTLDIGTVRKGEKIVFEVRSFVTTSDSPSSLLYVTNADYS